MSGTTRLVLIAAAVVVGVVAFAALRPSDDDDEEGAKQAVPVLRPGETHTIKVTRGELVRFVVRSPRADEAHVHGYNILKDVPAGGSVAFRFRAKFDGEFEVELENAGEELGHIEVTP